MSLISDALKTAQRERTGRAQSARNPQPLIDGFFPYISSAPAKGRKRIGVILGWTFGLGVVAAIAGGMVWFVMLAARQEPTPASKQPAIVLPPKNPVAQTTTPPDTTAIQTTSVVEMAEPHPATRSPETPAQSLPIRSVVREPVAQRAADAPATSSSESILRASTAPASRPIIRVDHEAEATALFNAGDLAGARDKFQLATRQAPTARAWTNYGVTLQRLGDNAGAAAAYQSAIGIDANYLEAWLYQGRLAAELRDFSRAVPLFQRARAINPRNAEVNVELARLEYDAGNWSEARRFAEDAVRADPNNVRGHWYFAVSSDQMKEADGAIRGYTAYLQAVSGSEREQAQFVGWARSRLAELRGKP